MPVIQPDTSAQVDMSPIEPGTYRAKIVSVDAGVSKAGNPKIDVHLEVTANGKVRPRTASLVTSGEGSWGFDQLLRATKFTQLADQYKDPSVNPKPGFDTDKLVGQEVNVVITEDVWQGNKRDKITGYLPA